MITEYDTNTILVLQVLSQFEKVNSTKRTYLSALTIFSIRIKSVCLFFRDLSTLDAWTECE